MLQLIEKPSRSTKFISKDENTLAKHYANNRTFKWKLLSIKGLTDIKLFSIYGDAEIKQKKNISYSSIILQSEFYGHRHENICFHRRFSWGSIFVLPINLRSANTSCFSTRKNEALKSYEIYEFLLLHVF